MAPPFVTYSWIGLTALTPLSALLLTWTLVSVHKRRVKSILLLAILYAQLLLQLLNFGVCTLTLLKVEGREYLSYMGHTWTLLVFFKSLTLVSLHLEEFYKVKSPSNYILNISSSLLKYHLLVLLLLSLMGTYLFRSVDYVAVYGSEDLVTVSLSLGFNGMVIGGSLGILGLKGLIRKRSLDVNIIIGTNSTSSSANLFGMREGAGGGQGRTGTAVAGVNLIINAAIIASTFSGYWLPYNWPLLNIITWSQVAESVLTSTAYWLARGRGPSKSKETSARYSSGSGAGHHSRFPIGNGSLCFNNGEFTYFAGGKNSNDEAVLNNATSSAYNTFDSFHQTRSYQDSLRCASVTTIANDDFEFHSRGYGLQILQQHEPAAAPQLDDLDMSPNNDTMIIRKSTRRRGMVSSSAASLSMNDLDLIDCSLNEGGSGSCSAASDHSNSSRHSNPKSKYKKHSNRIKRRYVNGKTLTRRVLSLESLHNHVNESHLAYLDTGERVIVFTTDFL